MTDLPWLVHGRSLVGVREVRGPRHNPEIVKWWAEIKRGGIKDDETPNCSAYVGAMFERAGIRSTRFEGAASWLRWGDALAAPTYGCVVVFARPGGHHVGFVVGVDGRGSLLVLGSNQDDSVSIAAFARGRARGYRWPSGFPWPADLQLALGSAPPSTKEA